MAKDLLLNDDFTPKIADGDFAIGDSEDQEVWLLLISQKSDFKFNPLAGADLVFLQNSPLKSSEMEKAIRQTLRNDGFRTIDVSITNEDFKVKAFRNG